MSFRESTLVTAMARVQIYVSHQSQIHKNLAGVHTALLHCTVPFSLRLRLLSSVRFIRSSVLLVSGTKDQLMYTRLRSTNRASTKIIV